MLGPSPAAASHLLDRVQESVLRPHGHKVVGVWGREAVERAGAGFT